MRFVSCDWPRLWAVAALLGGGAGCGADETMERPVPEECLHGTPSFDLAGFEPDIGEPTDIDGSPLDVTFSESPGFFTRAFALGLESTHPRAEIFFTLDGSEPDRGSVFESHCAAFGGQLSAQTFRYTGPIDLTAQWHRPNKLSLIGTGPGRGARSWSEPRGFVPKAAVVRAQAVLRDRISPVVTGTFFMDEWGRERFSLPVLSLSTAAAHLFDELTGIYVTGPDPENANFDQRGETWERPAHLEAFDEFGARPVAQSLGVRIHGNYTRSFPQKSLRLYARNEYGASHLRHPFFQTKPTREFKRLILRNGGNDWNLTLSRDAIFQSLIHHLPLDTQHASPSVLFINGEYWGIHVIRDRLDQFHLEIHHGVPREHVTILERDGSLAEGAEADVANYRAFIDELVAGNLDTADAIDRHVALPELLDYTIAQIYAGNSDWPHNNIGYWRYSGPRRSEERGPLDQRWRMLVFDVDRTLGRADSLRVDMVKRVFVTERNHWSRQLFRGFNRVQAVRHEFIQRTALHLATTFAPARVDEAIATYTSAIEPSIPDQIQRWGHPSSLEAYQSQLEVSHEFARRRAGLVREHMVSSFDEVPGTATVRLHNVDSARPPTLHGIRLSPDTPGVTLEEGRWQGEVFAGVPLVIESETTDWSEVTVDGAVESADRHPSNMTVVLLPDTTVDVYL